MKKVFNGLVIISLFMLAGCATSEAIYKNYEALVNTQDGVNAEEAKIIAQHVLISSDEKRNYRVTAPDIETIDQAKSYPEYWFIIFGHNWFSPISNDPTAKTYTELREVQFLVVIDKANGDIKFAGLWYPKRANNFDWVFLPKDSYKKDNPLALPPGEEVYVYRGGH